MNRQFISKLFCLVLVLGVLCSAKTAMAAGEGQQKAEVKYIKMESKIAENVDGFYAILPPGYTTAKKYPVLYMLHGYTNNAEDWIKAGKLPSAYEKALADGKAGEFIIICPNAGDEGKSFYMNYRKTDKKNNRYEDYFIQELIPTVDATFSTIKLPGARGIGGISMGGYGSFMLALRHPDLFNSVSSIAGPVNLMVMISETTDPNDEIFKIFGNDASVWKEYDPISLVKKFVAEKPDILKEKSFYLAHGTDDGMVGINFSTEMANLLKDSDLDVRFQTVTEEGHTYDFAGLMLPRILEFHWNKFFDYVQE